MPGGGDSVVADVLQTSTMWHRGAKAPRMQLAWLCVASMGCRAALPVDPAWRDRDEETIGIYGGMSHGNS